MSRRPHASTKRQSELEREMADDFEVVPLHDRVYEAVGEDDQLAALLDAQAEGTRAWQVREDYLGTDVEHLDDVFEAAETIGRVARERAVEVVAEACATVIADGDQWADEGHWSQTTIDGAKHEAREWLQTHIDVAERLGLSEEGDI